MSMFNTVKGMVTKTAKDAAKVSGDAVEYTRLKFKIAEINDEINQKYTSIGMMVYKSTLGEDTEADSIDEICAQITELIEKKEEYTEALGRMSNKKTCNACGEKIPADSAYCPKCGVKTDE